MKTIKINGKDYKIKYTIRALFIFERITGKAFMIQTVLDNYVLFYSILLANNPDCVISWDEFIDALDNNPSLIDELNKLNENQQNIEKMMEDEDAQNSTESKKI